MPNNPVIALADLIWIMTVVAGIHAVLFAILIVGALRLRVRAAGHLGAWQCFRAVLSATLPEPFSADPRLYSLMEDAWFGVRGQIVALVVVGMAWLVRPRGQVDLLFAVLLAAAALCVLWTAARLRRLAPQTIGLGRATLLATMWDAPQPLGASPAFQAMLTRAHMTMVALVTIAGVASFIEQAASLWTLRTARPG